MAVPKSTLQSAALLLFIGVAMVITLLILTQRFLGDTNTAGGIDQEYPTPTPDIPYVPIPDDAETSGAEFDLIPQ